MKARSKELLDRTVAVTVAALEAEIDTQVFRLYGLTPEETALIQAKP